VGGAVMLTVLVYAIVWLPGLLPVRPHASEDGRSHWSCGSRRQGAH